MKEIARGAEAVIYASGDRIVKERVSKGYRITELDNSLRGFRTRREAKVLRKLSEIKFDSPRLLDSDSMQRLEIELIKGEKLRDVIDNKNFKKFGKEIGLKIKKMHDNQIIHGDLTTSNMIFSDKLFFIDFGLSFFSIKVEDKAVDLHLLKQALDSKHSNVACSCFSVVLKAYGDTEVIKWLNDNVEKRGRNKRKTENI